MKMFGLSSNVLVRVDRESSTNLMGQSKASDQEADRHG